jgi:hypothetical protein
MINALFIAKTVLSIVEQMHELRRPKFLPSEGELCRMVEDVFWASLDKYEGIPLEVRLFFAPAMHGPHTLRLGSKIPLSPRAIRELSPAQAKDGGLVVAAGTGGGLAVHSLLGSSPTARGGMPHWIAVESRGPGLVLVRIGSKPIVEFVRGTISRLSGMPQDRTAAEVMLMGAGLSQNSPALESKIASMILDIGQAIDRSGTGGAIWILPPGHAMIGDLAGLGRTVEPNTELWTPFREMWDHRTATIALLNSPGGPSQQWLLEHPWMQCASQDWDFLRQDAVLRTVSGLAKVDGAIVMNGDPRVLAFGVICNRFASQPKSVLKSSNASLPMEGDPVDASSFGGSRHRSAIEFCANYAPAAAIVASHDGGLTVFAARTADVVVGSRVSVIDSDVEIKSSSTSEVGAT